MNKKIILLVIFVLVAIAQLYVPAKMIWDKEEVIETGNVYLFETAPIDPTDPFRGKYITLSFVDDRYKVTDNTQWQSGENIYVSITKNAPGVASIESVSKTRPNSGLDYFQASVRYVTGTEEPTLTIEFPFDRYYMEESKAYEAEVVYRESRRDTSVTAYAVVKVKEGQSVLEDVMINGISIREVVKSNRETGVTK